MSRAARSLWHPWALWGLGLMFVPWAVAWADTGRPAYNTMLTLWRRPLVRMGLDRNVIESQATPLVDERRGQVICGTGEGELFAIDSNDVHVRWRYSYVAPIESQPALFTRPASAADGRAPARSRRTGVAVGSKDGALLALDADTGALWWRAALDGEVRAAPLGAHGTLFATTARNQLFALDAIDGRVRWSVSRAAPMGMSVLGHAGVLKRGGQVFTSFSDGFALAADANSGATHWQRPLSLGTGRFRDADATPVSLGATVAFASLSDGIYALSPDDGQTVWQQPLQNVAQLTRTPAAAKGPPRLFAGDADGALYALAPETGRILWRTPIERGPVRAVVAWHDKLLAFADEQGVRVLSQRDGRLLETLSLGGRPGGALSVNGVHAAHLSSQGALLLWQLFDSPALSASRAPAR